MTKPGEASGGFPRPGEVAAPAPLTPGSLTGGQAPQAWGAYAAAPRGVPMGFRIAPPLRCPSPMCVILLRCKRVVRSPPAVQRSACFYHAERLFVARRPAWPPGVPAPQDEPQRFAFDAPTLIFAGEPLDYFSGICHFSHVLSPLLTVSPLGSSPPCARLPRAAGQAHCVTHTRLPQGAQGAIILLRPRPHKP